jgi:hypothetical protein
MPFWHFVLRRGRAAHRATGRPVESAMKKQDDGDENNYDYNPKSFSS